MSLTTIALSSFTSLAALVASVSSPVLADPAPVVSHHSIQLNKAALAYTAAFTEIELKDDTGGAVATLSAISYVRDGVKTPADRPVIFLFNGGPGASSSPLHMSAFGPRIRTDGKDAKIVDNPNTLLDTADLVFIDPVGTGLNHVYKPDELGQFLGVDHDASAVLGLIDSWIEANHRDASPVYIVGESYGGARLAVIAGDIAEQKLPINLKGLVLISPALDFSTSADMGQVLQLPTLAAGAWYHGKVDRHGLSLPQFVQTAQSFAAETYAPALIKSPHISESELQSVAKGLAGFTGLSADSIIKSNLRIDSETFLSDLNADRTLNTGRLDMRVTALKAPPLNTQRPAAANDPSLGLGKSNVITSPLITAYLRDELNVPVTSEYVGLSLELNFKWNWSDTDADKKFALNLTPDLAKLLHDRPEVKVLVVGGYFDLATPLWEARYAIEHADIPRNRVQFEAYETGHSVFNPDAGMADRTKDIRHFVKPDLKE
jgi:carboxypeptidase C (cathepsin A)